MMCRKSMLLSVLLLAGSLHAQDMLQQSEMLLNTYSSDLYNLGIKKYKQGAYQETLDIYNNMLRSNPHNPRINFMVGISAFALKKYKEALGAFDRVLAVDKTHLRSRLERARTLYRLGQVERSKQEFIALRSEKLPGEARRKVDAYLDAINSKGSRHKFNGAVMVGVMFDDNVENTTSTESFVLPVNNLELTRSSDIDEDTSHIELATLKHLYDFGDKEGYGWGSEITGYLQSWSDHDNRNIGYGSLSTGLVYQSQEYRYAIPVVVDKLWYGSKDYMQVLGLAPSLDIKTGRESHINFNTKVQKKSYTQEADSSKDANYFDVGTKFGTQLFKDSAIELGYTVMMERKEDGSNPYVDYDAHQIKAKYIQALNKNFKVDLNAAVKQTDYLDEDPNFLLKRSDTQTNLGVGVNARLTKEWLMNGTYNYIMNDSNRVVSDYDKSTMFFNVMYGF